MELESSYHFEMDMAMSVSQGSLSMDIPITSVGDFQAPDRSQIVSSMTFLGLNVEFKVITIGDTTYQTDPETGLWEVGADSTTPFGDFETFAVEGVSDIEDLVFVTEETLDGTRVFHLTGTAPPEAFGEEEGELQIELWIGVEDKLIRQIVVEGEISFEGDNAPLFGDAPAGSGTVTMTMKFSNFGKPVSIEAPQVGATSSSF